MGAVLICHLADLIPWAPDGRRIWNLRRSG